MIKFPDNRFITEAWTIIEKSVAKMPKKPIDKKFLKNSGFFRS